MTMIETINGAVLIRSHILSRTRGLYGRGRGATALAMTIKNVSINRLALAVQLRASRRNLERRSRMKISITSKAD